MATDTKTQKMTDVTDNFITYNYDGEQVTVSELFLNTTDWYYETPLDITVYDNIPDSSIFTVKITLESGKELINQTQEINFK